MDETNEASFSLSPELWASFGNHGAVPQLFTPNASSYLSTDQRCLWTSSCSDGSYFPEKMDVETGTDRCMFSFASDMKTMMALLSVAASFLIFIAWLASFLCSTSVPGKYVENGSLWGVGSSRLVQGTVRHKEEKEAIWDRWKSRAQFLLLHILCISEDYAVSFFNAWFILCCFISDHFKTSLF